MVLPYLEQPLMDIQTQEKKELELILVSPDFSRAKKLQQALLYLCEWRWSKNGDAPTQYDLAQELYGDGAETEINVRNLIMRLRTKLNEYYALQGHPCELRLEIPRGEYRVVFHRLDLGAETVTPSEGKGPRAIVDPSERNGDETTLSAAERPGNVPPNSGSSNACSMNGVENGIEYIVVESKESNNGADPSMEGLFLRRFFGRPSRSMRFLVYLAVMVVLAMLIGWGVSPREDLQAANDEEKNEERLGSGGGAAIGREAAGIGTAENDSSGDARNAPAVLPVVADDKKTLVFKDSDGDTVGTVKLEGKIIRYEELPAPVGKTGRYIVAFGGRTEGFGETDWVRPQVIVISENGKRMMKTPIDLLAAFNPFRSKYEEKLFKLELLDSIDFDCDDYFDGVLKCSHQYYPDILYFVSGASLEIGGAFGNSGRMHFFAAGPVYHHQRSSTRRRVLGVLAANNHMGSQDVFFTCGMGRYGVSPDILDEEFSDFVRDINHIDSYRPLGELGNFGVEFDAVENGLFRISMMDGKKILINSSAHLTTDPWYPARANLDPQSDAAKRSYELLYPKMRQAESYVKNGQVEDGVYLFWEALRLLNEIGLGADYPLVHAVKSRAISVLKQAGRAELAPQFLPFHPAEVIHAGRLSFRKGELLLLLNRNGAAQKFEESYDTFDMNGLCEMYVTARILGGDDVGSIFRGLDTYFDPFPKNPIWRSWFLIPALLREEPEKARDQAGSIVYLEPEEAGKVNEHRYFPQQRDIWNALVDIELDRVPQYPDVDRPLLAENSQREMVDARLQMLEAVDMYHRVNRDEGLVLLVESYTHLRELSRRDTAAIIPFVYVAYKYGFAAYEAGDHEAAVEALRAARDRYPWGKLAERAKALLN